MSRVCVSRKKGKSYQRRPGKWEKLRDRILKVDLFGRSRAFEKVAVLRLERLFETDFWKRGWNMKRGSICISYR